MLKRIALSAMTAVLCLAAGAGTAQARTTAASAHRPGLAGIKVINLRRSFEAHLAHVKPHRISGIIYARGKRPGAARAASNTTCTEPNCDLVYNGGPVQHSPQVFIDFWGPNWLSDAGQEASAVYLKRLFKGLGTESGVPSPDMWSTITSQYGDGTGYPSFTGAVFAAAYNDTAAPPAGATQTDLAAEADAFGATLTSMGYTIGNDSQLVIATQSGTCPQDFYAPNCQGGTGYYCAWHSYSKEPFINLPYLLDAGSGCGENFVNSGSTGVNDGWSIVGGHEYAETVTDPLPPTGWIDANDGVSGGEIGDKCAWGGQIWGSNDPSGNLKLHSGTFAMQSLWSNADAGCAMQSEVTLLNPGDQTLFVGAKSPLQLQGSSTAGPTLAWSATGLPSGLVINSTTGLISGAPTVNGVFAVTVTDTDVNNISEQATFSWTVPPDAGKPVKGYHSKCLDDHSSIVTDGTKVDIYSCNGTGAQKWSLSSTGKLIVLGVCLTDPAGGKSGAKLVVSTCHNYKSQKWTHRSNGEYVLKLNGLCLTDPSRSTTNGTQVQLRACHDYADQRWSLP